MPLLPKALPRLFPILTTDPPHIAQSSSGCSADGRLVSIAGLKTGFEGRSTPERGLGSREPSGFGPWDPEDFSPQHAPRPSIPVRARARAQWRRGALRAEPAALGAG